ncbi:MAG TPA: hypothetical protein VFQ38_07210 [Longimicrobiales bacterium]|nr:hypothetical protein [Longimicrobiales bacterium]
MALLLAAVLLGAAAAVTGLAAQSASPAAAVDEVQLLRQEEQLEAAGNLAAAEELLRSILTRDPGSLSALISLERLLRVQGRLADIFPSIDGLLKSDPTSPIAHQMRIRAYSSLDRTDELEKAAEAWIKATPKLETPYREIASVWKQRGDAAKALAVLQQGRQRIGGADALAFELGDVYADVGNPAAAAKEWSAAIGRDARGFNLVQRRLSALADGGAQIIPGIIDGLTHAPTTPARQRAAATLAVDAGLGSRAEAIVRQVAGGLKGADRESFLVEVARRADGAHLSRLAYWAYSQLLTVGGSSQRLLAIRSRLAELALQAGDTATARESYRVLEAAAAAGSPERREALALRIELEAHSGDVAGAAKTLATFRQEFPDAGELDRLAAAVANAYLVRGDGEGAEQVLAGVTGPRTGLVQGRIALQKGDITRARSILLAAAPGLQGTEGTDAVALVSLLTRLSPEAGKLLGRAVAKITEGKAGDAVALLSSESTDLPAGERAAVLDFAAGVAARAGLDEQAETLRRTLITDFPRALETPAAMLALARALSDRPQAFVEARQLLERLIIDYPRSALVPEARRELDLLQGRVPRS